MTLLDDVTRDRLLGFLGREPHPSAAGQKILHIRAPAHSHRYRFEWHPQSRKVYLVRIGTVPEHAELLAYHIETHGDAINAVLIWSRGFTEGRAPDITKPHLTE